MKRIPMATGARLSLLTLAAVLAAGCTSTSSDGFLAGDKVDYRSGAVKTRPLEVPPDLTQLSRDPRYAPQGGVISAAASVGAGPAQLSSPTLSSVAPNALGKVRVERQGNQRWLVVDGVSPEALWPELRSFWQERGFTLTLDNPEAGVMETDWAENRAKLPNDLIRSTLGKLIDKLYDTGERDRFRTRVERVGSGAEIYITHRGLEEVYIDERKEMTAWRPRNTDPQLEADVLAKLMARLGTKEEAARTAVASAPEAPARARPLAGKENSALEVDEPFDRAWRRVGLALDRSGFTVEDRDRSAGLYFVRYIDPKTAGKEDPGFFARLFGASPVDKSPARYRVQVKGQEGKSVVAVLSSAGAAEASETGRNIVALLVRELR